MDLLRFLLPLVMALGTSLVLDRVMENRGLLPPNFRIVAGASPAERRRGAWARSSGLLLVAFVLAIGISGQMHGEVLVGDDHEPIGNVRLWCDGRNASEAAELTTALLSRFRTALPGLSDSSDELHKLLDREMPLAVLTDIIAYTLDLDVAVKQGLLEETSILRRARQLVASLEQRGAIGAKSASHDFPPGFSLN